MQPTSRLQDLLAIMAALRDPLTGCPWDLKQDFKSIAPYTLEEAYEVADAAERGDMAHLCDELGDLLLQVVFFAQMANEKQAFKFDDVVHAINSKLIRRHPHIFSGRKADTPDEVKAIWDEIKSFEKKDAPDTFFGDVPVNMPGMQRAVSLQDAASKVGFDWNNPRAVLAKIREELDEFEAELNNGDAAREAEEYGDVLFTLANLARHRKIDPEQAVRDANGKFVRRFGEVERRIVARGGTLSVSTLDDMEAVWNVIKAEEKSTTI